MERNITNSASPAAVESTGGEKTGEDDLVSAMQNLEITERRNREKALKRPTSTADQESDEDQEPELYELETHKQLAAAIPGEYRRTMHFMGSEGSPRLVAEMRLGPGDLEERLVVPARKLRCKFLSAAEEEELKREKRLNVEIVDPNNTVSMVTLTAEKAAATAEKTAAYVITDWSGIVERNNLVEGNLIELWCFRVADGKFSRLCFMVFVMVELNE